MPVVFFWRELAGLSVFAGFDFTHLILPLHDYAREALWSGSLPHWNPYLFAGFPQIAEGEGGLFYPGNLLMWLPGDQSVLLSWNIVGHLIFTGCLMYAFLRGRGASRTSAGWLAVLYQLVPGLILRFETVGLFQAVAWIPGFYWACEIAVAEGESGKWWRWLLWTMLASAALSMMYLAGSSQIAFYTMVGLVFFLGGVAAMGPGPRTRAFFGLGTFLICGAFGVVLAAVQLIPTAELAQFSQRIMAPSYEFYKVGTWITLPRLASLFLFPAVREPGDLLDYVSSLGYIGLFPFILAGMTLSLQRRNMNPILAPFFLVFFGLILAFGFNFTTWHDLVTLPGFRLFRALGRMILPTQVALFCLSAVSLDALLKTPSTVPRDKRLKSGAWWSAAIAVILLAWYLFEEGFPITGFQVIGLVNLGILTIIVTVGLVGYFRTRNTVWLNGLLVVWLGMQFAGGIPARSAITIDRGAFNDIRGRLQLEGIGLESDTGRPVRVLVSEGQDVWDPLMERLSTDPMSPGESLPIPALGNEFALGGVGVLNGYTPLISWRWHDVMVEYASKGIPTVEEASPRARAVFAISCTDAIATPTSFTGGEDFSIPDADMTGILPSDWHLVQTPESVPYASIPDYVEAWEGSAWEFFKFWITQEDYVPGEWVCIEPPRDIQLPDGMEWGKHSTPRDIADYPLPSWAGWELPEGAQCEITSVERDHGIIEIETVSDTPFWLVIRESYFNGWNASIDGESAVIVPADYLFCAIAVPDGERSVRMEYITPGLRDGALVSGLGWLIWLIAMTVSFLAKRKRTV